MLRHTRFLASRTPACSKCLEARRPDSVVLAHRLWLSHRRRLALNSLLAPSADLTQASGFSRADRPTPTENSGQASGSPPSQRAKTAQTRAGLHFSPSFSPFPISPASRRVCLPRPGKRPRVTTTFTTDVPPIFQAITSFDFPRIKNLEVLCIHSLGNTLKGLAAELV